MVTTTLLVVRHAQTDGNLARIFQGQIDRELSEAGKCQLELLTNRFKTMTIHAIYTSPLPRAVKTAKAIAVAQPVPVMLDDRNFILWNLRCGATILAVFMHRAGRAAPQFMTECGAQLFPLRKGIKGKLSLWFHMVVQLKIYCAGQADLRWSVLWMCHGWKILRSAELK